MTLLKQDNKRGKADWEALELQYIVGNMTMHELADAHKLNRNTLCAQAVKRDWQEKRTKKRNETQKAVEEVATDERITQQINQNRADLSASAAIGAKVLEMLLIAEKPADVKALSGALKDCQAVARLALGMTTENNGHSGLDGKDIGIISKILIVGGKSVDSIGAQQ